MRWLHEHTQRIRKLLEEDDLELLTLAALRARLALEKVCYERLRNAHDYLSPSDLKRWQPGAIINQLIQEVDPHASESFTISAARQPDGANGERPPDSAFVVLGTQAGFDAAKLARLWNALGSLLHVKLPSDRHGDAPIFRDADTIRRKVAEALEMLEEIGKGTLISNGIGPTVSFPCACGATIKRRSDLLKEGQTISCIDPTCIERWAVVMAGDEYEFERLQVEVPCNACGTVALFPQKLTDGLDRDEHVQFECVGCGATSYFMWRLMLVEPDTVSDSEAANR